jgi:hypothetical protein
MNVSKYLYIKSTDQLYRLISENSTLSENNKFLPFIDFMYDYYNGCRCNEDYNIQMAKQEYDIISKDAELIIQMVEYFQCDGVRFLKLDF